MTRSAPSLVTLVVRRILIFSLIAMGAQLAGVIVEYWDDELRLGSLAIEHETEILAQGFTDRMAEIGYVLPPAAGARYAGNGSHYFARISTMEGQVLFSNCDPECSRRFLPFRSSPPSLWISETKIDAPIRVIGGHIIPHAGMKFVIEVAIIGDTDGVITSVWVHEIADHMILPMGLILFVVLGATALSIYFALAPVREAVQQLDTSDPVSAADRIPTKDMPAEVARFASAVNRAFDRVNDVIEAQKIFTSAISHEVRTPLAVAALELEKIDHPRARKIEHDLEDLNRLVDQLTTLARLESSDIALKVPIDPLVVAREVVSAIVPLAYRAGQAIEFREQLAESFSGYPDLIADALRNLLENAIKHAQKGSNIIIQVGPGSSFVVTDEYVGQDVPKKIPLESKRERRQGLGLKIVQRIVEIHGGTFELAGLAKGGKSAVMKFQPQSGNANVG